MPDPRSPARPEDVIRGALRSRPFPPETEAALAALAVLLAERDEYKQYGETMATQAIWEAERADKMKSQRDERHTRMEAAEAERDEREQRITDLEQAARALVDKPFGQLDPRAFYALREVLDGVDTGDSDVCACGHWSRHHSVGKHGGCGHCTCKGFSPGAGGVRSADAGSGGDA